jgi:hypothetical protein
MLPVSRLPPHPSKSFTLFMLIVFYIASLIRWWITKDREGHDLGVLQEYHGILSVRTWKNHNSQESLCTGWYADRDIFDDRSLNNILHHLSYSPADIRRYIICTVGKASLSNPRINLWGILRSWYNGLYVSIRRTTTNKEIWQFLQGLYLSGGNHFRFDVVLWPVL